MTWRYLGWLGALAGVALGLGALFIVATHDQAGSATTATSQFGCTFSVSEPAIANGQANSTVTATCTSSARIRKLDVDLVADDPSYDDTLRQASTSIPAGAGKYSVTGRSWACREDSLGKDEVYLRVRIETHRGTSWQKAKWVNGSAASGDCH